MGNDWDGDTEAEYTLVDTGTQFARVRKAKVSRHDYVPSDEVAPRKMQADPPCTCGEPKNSPCHK